MKKIVAMMATITLATSVAWGTININWTTQLGPMIDQNTGLGLPDGSILQLIWTPGPFASPLDINNPLTPTGDDILLVSTVSQFDGFNLYGTTGNLDAGDFGMNTGDFLPGYVYTRAFNSAAPTAAPGNYYADSFLVGGPLNDASAVPNPGPNSLDTSGMLVDQLIPEPSVFALLGFGSLLLIVRRRFVTN